MEQFIIISLRISFNIVWSYSPLTLLPSFSHLPTPPNLLFFSKKKKKPTESLKSLESLESLVLPIDLKAWLHLLVGVDLLVGITPKRN